MGWILVLRSCVVLALLLCGGPLAARQAPSPAVTSPTELAIPRPDLGNQQPVLVLSVVDGDTINVLVDEAIEKVRLVGVDAPDPNNPRGQTEFHGAESTAFLSNLLRGERVYLVPVPGVGRDKLGRRHAHAYRAPDGLWVNLELVRQGYAMVDPDQPFESLELFLSCQRLARKAEKGLWDAEAREFWELARLKEAEPPPQPAPPLAVAPVSTPAPTPATQAPPPSVKPPSDSPASDADRATVYVTRTGSKYHRAGCSYLSKSSIPIALKEASSRYGPCSRCNPPR